MTSSPEPVANSRGASTAVKVLLAIACLVASATLVDCYLFVKAISRVGWLYPLAFWGLTAPFVAIASVVFVLCPALLLRRRTRHPLLKASIVICGTSLAVLVVQFVVVWLTPSRPL